MIFKTATYTFAWLRNSRADAATRGFVSICQKARQGTFGSVDVSSVSNWLNPNKAPPPAMLLILNNIKIFWEGKKVQKLCAAYMWHDINNNDRAKLRKYTNDNFANTKWFVEKPNYSNLHYSERPMLQKAATFCASKNAQFIMLNARLQKKIDGLTWLSQQKFDFHVLDMPSLNRDNLCHAVQFASDDVQVIAGKTRAALQQIKADIADGKAHISHAGNMISKLGAPDPSVANKSKSAKVLERTMCLYHSHLKDMRAEGLSYAAMADRLNKLSVSPPFNTVFDQELQEYITFKPGDAEYKIWHSTSVRNYFLRGELNAKKNKTRIADEKGGG